MSDVAAIYLPNTAHHNTEGHSGASEGTVNGHHAETAVTPLLTDVNNLSLLDAALAYSEMGFRVHPLEDDGKKPRTRWTQDATTDPKMIRFWWDQWPNANIGIVMGNGTHALDLDNKNGSGGWESYLAAGGPSNPPGPVQETPSGGKHILFRYGGRFRNFTKKGVKGGLDMRSDNGYIAAAPSVIEGKPYRWLKSGNGVPMPENLLRTLVAWGTPAPDPTGASEGTVNGPHAETAVAPPGEAESGPQEPDKPLSPALRSFEGLQAQAAAAKRTDMRAVQSIVMDSYRGGLDQTEQEALLYTLKESTGFSLKLLRGILQRISRELRVERRNDKFDDNPTNEVWLLKQGQVIERETNNLIPRDSFLMVKAREFEGNIADAAQHYLKGPKAVCSVASDMTYLPDQPHGLVYPEGAQYPLFNTYRPTALGAKYGTVHPWVELLESMSVQGGKATQEELLDRLAFIIQRPGEKMNCGIILGGGHGIGKDSLIAPVIKAVGEHNVNTIMADELHSDFTSYQEGAKLLVLEEIAIGGHKDAEKIAHKIKPLCAAPPDTLRVNNKGIRPYEVPNLIQMIGFTNVRHAAFIERGDRRLFSVWCDALAPERGTAERRAFEAGFTKYWYWLDTGGFEAIHYFLRERDIRHLNPRAAPTCSEWEAETVERSESPLTQWLRTRIVNQLDVFALPVTNTATVMHAVRQDYTMSRYHITERAVGDCLRAVGATKKHTKRGNFWVLRHGFDLNTHGSEFWRSALVVAAAGGTDTLFALDHDGTNTNEFKTPHQIQALAKRLGVR